MTDNCGINKEDNKTFVAITSIDTRSDCQDNRIQIRYQILTSDQESRIHDRFYYGTDKLEQKTNTIILEKPDPKLIYTIFRLLGRIGEYPVVEYKEDGLEF